MKSTTRTPLALLFLSLALHSLGWFFKAEWWAGADVLILAGGALATVFAVLLGLRIAQRNALPPLD